MKHFLFFLFATLFFAGNAQVVLDASSNGTTVYTCDELFTDSGGNGPGMDYSSNENYVITICPDHPGYTMLASFMYMELGDGDVLIVYDGNSTSAPVIGTFDDIQDGDSITGTPSNQSGCLTFQFISDGIDNSDGWLADMICVYPCQAFTANAFINGQAFSDDPLKLCVGETVALQGLGVYPYSAPLFSGATWPSPPYSQTFYADSLYHQSDANSDFEWNIEFPPSNQDTENGPSVNHTFTEPGIYTVFLEVRDTHPSWSCYASNYLEQIVWVSAKPTFNDSLTGNLTRPESSTICLGNSVQLFGHVSSETFAYVDMVDTPDPTPINDFEPGWPKPYSSPILIQYQGGQVLTDPSQLSEICIELEHAAAGDLEITITCPSGQSVTLLHADPTDNLDDQVLGEPVNDLENGAPGVPYSYCFSNTAGMTLNDAALVIASMQSIPSGTYLPYDGDFSQLVGCSVNGVWSLTVEDTQVGGDGWVTGWNMNFTPDLVSPIPTSFTNSFTNYQWSGPDIPADQTFNDTLTLTPSAVGTYTYNFSVTNDFGCSYDTTVTFNVIAAPDPFFILQSFVCTNVTVEQASTVTPGGVFSVSANSPAGLNMSASGQINPSLSTPGFYDVVHTLNNGVCPEVSDTFSIEVRAIPYISAGPDISICVGDILSINVECPVPFNWTPTDPNGLPPTTVPYTMQFGATATMNGCSNVDYVVVSVHELPNPALGPSGSVCQNELPITLTPGLGFTTYSWSTGATTSTISVTESGNYGVTVTNEFGCSNTDDITISVLETPTANAGADRTICAGDTIALIAAVEVGTTISWSPNVSLDGTISPAVTTTYTLVVTSMDGCIATDQVVVFVDPCLGLEENTIEVALYPNPSSGVFEITSTVDAPMSVHVTNLAGELIETKTSNSDNVLMDLSAQPSGTYLVQVSQGGITKTFRWVKVG